MRSRPNLLVAAAAFPAIAWSLGCSERGQIVRSAVERGDYGRARAVLLEKLETDPNSRRFLYERMMLELAELADGLPGSAEPTTDEAYQILRTQGKNADKTAISMVVGQKIKFWKGEPFEQAMMWFYIAVQKAWINEWDNARAAAGESIFHLKDFGEFVDDKGNRRQKQPEDIEAEARRSEDPAAYVETGYTPVESNFALGYLLKGVADQALDRTFEAREHFESAVAVRPQLKPIVERLERGPHNALLVVDYGFGPRKENYGPDGCFSRFVPAWPSGEEPLFVTVNGQSAGQFAAACDLNGLALDQRWKNNEEIANLVRSIAGRALQVSGSQVGGTAGAIMSVSGAALRASAKADTTHCMIMPQRVYVAPLLVTQNNSVLDVQVGPHAPSRMVLPGIDPPVAPDRMRLIYVRMTPHVSPAWATAGKVLYANDAYDGAVEGAELPYVLGGRCVRLPSLRSMADYHGAGYLQGVTVEELESAYRDEGLQLGIEDSGERAGLHVLEGGNSLVCPQPGSAGFLRLFCQEHSAYSPKSDAIKRLAAQVRQERESRRTASAQ